MRRKVLAMVLSAVMTAGVLAGCGNSSAEKSTADTKGTDSKEATYTVGISQFAEHGSLDNCREGFLEGLKEAGIEEGVNLDVILDNAQADTGTAATIADNFVSKNVDLICAIATPAAMSAYNSTKGTEIPVIYTAVSDPVAAQLATEDGTPVGNITGTSDALPVEEQLKMIRATLPDAKKIGIKVNMKNVDYNVLDPMRRNGEFDLIISNILTANTGDPEVYLNWYWKSNINGSQPQNSTGYSNPQYDALSDKLSVEFDPAKRREYMIQMQQILLDDGAALFFGYPKTNMVSKAGLANANIFPADYYWLTKDVCPKQ